MRYTNYQRNREKAVQVKRIRKTRAFACMVGITKQKHTKKMSTNDILKQIFKADKAEHFTPSETRLLFVLLSIHTERANEKGEFCATLDEVCKRYGSKDKNHIRKIRDYLCEIGVFSCFTSPRKPSIYKFNGYKNIPNKNIPNNGYKNIPLTDQKTENQSESDTTESEPQKTTPFKAATPQGKTLYYSTEENAREAQGFCSSVCSLLMGEPLQKVEAFFTSWATENTNKKLPFLLVRNFDIQSTYYYSK